MATTKQLKHRARFHSAVLRYLFPPSPPHSSSGQEPVHGEEVYFQDQSPKGAGQLAEEKYSDHEDDSMEAGKALLSRAQRKRWKSKKLKEEQSDAMPVKKFIGPSLPDVLEKRRPEVVGCISACALLQDQATPENCRNISSTVDSEDVHDVQKDEFSSTAKSLHRTRELESCTEVWEGKDGHDKEPWPLSKAKRRRLAKKKFQDNLQRRPLASSSFTAEVKGGDIVIKQMV